MTQRDIYVTQIETNEMQTDIYVTQRDTYVTKRHMLGTKRHIRDRDILDTKRHT